MRRLICIGDVHGNLRELKALWSALLRRLGPAEVSRSSIVFLGDYCDRGPDTKSVLDYLIALETDRSADPDTGGTHFLTGNHDFGMAAYLGCLPASIPPAGFDLDATKPPSYKTGYWKFRVEGGGMHYQGRRWGGSPVYDAAATFRSYGVRLTYGEADRDALIGAVPEEHKTFLSRLLWVHEEELLESNKADDDIDNTNTERIDRTICVHAGLLPDRPLDVQLDALRRRDLTADVLYKDNSPAAVKERIVPFVGRGEVMPLHPELEGKRTTLVSGHHGRYFVDNNRIIIDESGGMPSIFGALQAIILPDRIVVPHYGDPDDQVPVADSIAAEASTVAEAMPVAADVPSKCD